MTHSWFWPFHSWGSVFTETPLFAGSRVRGQWRQCKTCGEVQSRLSYGSLGRGEWEKADVHDFELFKRIYNNRPLTTEPESVHVVQQVTIKKHTGVFLVCCGLTGTAERATTDAPFLVMGEDGNMMWVGMPSQTMVKLKELIYQDRVAGHTYIADVRPNTCKKCADNFYNVLGQYDSKAYRDVLYKDDEEEDWE